MIPYARFYRAYGIRKPEFLLAPPMPSLTRLTFPFFSVYHYLGAGVGDLGPSQNDPMIAAQPTQSAIEHVDHLSLLESHPAKMPVSFQQLVRKHRALNNKFVPVKKLDQVAKNQRVLITFNYSLLDPMYRYKRMRLASKFKNQNKLTTVVNKINEVAREISHQQFLMVDLPEFLPSIAEMRTAMKVMTDDGIRKFASLDSYFILQMWLWLGRDRELSDLAKLEENAARFTNVVFRDAGRFVVVNLGELDSWRKLEKGDLQEGDADKGGTKDKITLQRGFLSMLTRMTTARTEAVSENIEEVDGPSEGEFDASVSQDQSEDSGKTGDGEATDDEIALRAEEVDRDLASLDLIGAPVEDPDEEDLVDIVEETQSNPVPRPVNTGRKFGIDPRIAQARQDSRIDLPVFAENFTEVLDDVATNSTMGVSEFRKFSEQAANYAGIKAPENTNGFTTLGEFATVSPKETEISTVAKVPDIGNVFDKSMLETTLLDFTNRYVENFLQRDIAGMVVSLQNAGVLVKDYQVEEVNTVTGAYYAYSVEVKPIQGQPSVMHFRVPKVNEEGQFVINGTKYYMRMQRGD